MISALRRMRGLAWIFFGLGVLAVIGFGADLIWFGYLSAETMIIVALAVIGILSVCLLFFAYFFSFRIEKMRHLADLKATDIVGNDIQAAYEFGRIGLIVTDADGVILWMNDFLTEHGINLVDYSIRDLSPLLLAQMKKDVAEDDDDEETADIKYLNRYYHVRYIRDANLFILRDTTEYEALVDFNKAHASVVGYLNLDNYSDIANFSESEKVDVEGRIRRMIIDYFRRFNCLLKPLRPDTYMIMLNREDLDRMTSDRFSLISVYGKEFASQGLTLSLGFGYGFRNISQNDELASNSIDIAMSRGGNQCVVAPNGENMLFYGGGNSEVRSSSNMVRIKAYARSFIMALEHASNIIIIPHINADMDCIGACLGVYAICRSIKTKDVRANILYDNQNVEQAADAAVRASLPTEYFSKVFVSSQKANELKSKDTLLVVLDHNRPAISIYPPIYSGDYVPNICVIDHHRKQDDSFKNPMLEHVDTSSSSTCEMLALYLDSLPFKIGISDAIATIMLSGIYLDTENFEARTSILTHEAAIILTRIGADEYKARDFLKENYESFAIKARILASVATRTHGVLIASAPDDEYVNPSLLASVCNELVRIEDINAAFAIGRTSRDSVYISSRGNGNVNCELLMLKLGGGGHFSAAAAALKDVDVKQASDKLSHILDEYLEDAMTGEDQDS